jgi:hypothetical protein
MNLDEAIQRLEQERIYHHSYTTDLVGKAMQLGIEALKREQIRRRPPYIAPFGPLPGETEE